MSESARAIACPAEQPSSAAVTNWRALLWPFVVGAVVRVAAFPFAEDLWGDAPARADIAARWAAEPGLWWAFDRVFQYGPLPLHLGGVAVWLGLARDVGPRLTALVAGLAGIVLAARLAARLGGRGAATAAALAVALSPLHIQSSVTFASEAFFAAFVLGCVERALARDVPGCAAWAFAASTTRYDAWLWIPLLALWWLWRGQPRARARALLAGALLGVGPASILLANALAGNPMAPLDHISREHIDLAVAARRAFGEWFMRATPPFYWPAALLLCLTPAFGLYALQGTGRALRERGEALVPALAALVPPAVYALRTMLGTFRPMVRFALAPSILLACLLPPLRRRTLAVCVTTAVVANVGLVAVSWNAPPHSVAEYVAAFSPVPRLPGDLRLGSEAIRNAPGLVVLDFVSDYTDILVAWHSGGDRWNLQHPPAGAVPRRIVAMQGGALDAELQESAKAFGRRYRIVGGAGRVTVWDLSGP